MIKAAMLASVYASIQESYLCRFFYAFGCLAERVVRHHDNSLQKYITIEQICRLSHAAPLNVAQCCQTPDLSLVASHSAT